MAGTPKFKIYSGSNEYVAAIKYAADAARLVAGQDGWTIRTGHAKKDIRWTEGTDKPLDSFDEVAAVVHGRQAAALEAAQERYGGRS